MSMKSWKDEKQNIHKGKALGSKNGFDVIECNNCGYKHCIPIPTKEFLENYYKDKFVKNRPSGFYEKVERDYPWLNILYNEKYDVFEKHIKSDSRRILDIGSGLGFFLKTGKDRGWDVCGVEASTESVEYSNRHGIDVRNFYLDKSNFSGLGTFDVVHMHEVIEHLPSPLDAVNMAAEMLCEGGLLCIASPNDFNLLQEAFVSDDNLEKWWISPPEHINYFDFNSIQNLLKNNGFKVLDTTTTFPLELFLLMGSNYIGNNEIGSNIHQMRVNFETNLKNSGNEFFRRKLYKNLSELGIGREFVIFAKKISKK
jgi:2-polyprenyl-3-methyl-5-hydroxy-6-metoxy-1,4-benzoquinol methylase